MGRGEVKEVWKEKEGVTEGRGDRNGQKFSGKLVTFETIAIEILPLSRSF